MSLSFLKEDTLISFSSSGLQLPSLISNLGLQTACIHQASRIQKCAALISISSTPAV
jgi:hypothetical protein